MKVSIQERNGELVLPIPQSIAAEIGIGLGAEVDLEISPRGDALVVRPREISPPGLASLLEGICEENLHGEIDTGPPVTAEAW